MDAALLYDFDSINDANIDFFSMQFEQRFILRNILNSQ